MRKNLLLGFSLAAFVALTTGCAFTKSTVKIDFKPPVYTDKVSVDKIIVVQKLNDLRDGDPFLLSYKGVGMKTSGTYVTEEEVAVIITEAIKDTLTSLNYKIAANQGDLVLTGELVKLDSTPIMGFWSGDLDCTIELNLKLSDAKTGKLLWSDIITGFNKETGMQVDSEAHRKASTEAAIGDLMQKFAASASFKSTVQNYAGQ
jgi:hypothetical protein